MFSIDIRHDFRSVPLRVAEHTLWPSAVAEPEIFEMFAAKAELDRGEPKVPIFEAEPHALVEASAPLEYSPPDEAAGLTDILFQMAEHRVLAGVITVPFLSEHVDVRINPADLRILHKYVASPLQGARQKAIVGIEKIDGLSSFPNAEDEIDAGIARGAQSAIRPADVVHAIGCRRSKIEAGLVRLRHRAAVVDDDDYKLEVGPLVQRRDDGFGEQHAVLVDGNDNGEPRPRGRSIRREIGRLRLTSDPASHCEDASGNASTTNSSHLAWAQMAAWPSARRVARKRSSGFSLGSVSVRCIWVANSA